MIFQGGENEKHQLLGRYMAAAKIKEPEQQQTLLFFLSS